MEAYNSVTPSQEGKQEISFSHVQVYVDGFADLGAYKDLERSLNEFHRRVFNERVTSLERKRHIWSEVSKSAPSAFVPHNRDLVTQLMVGFGFRVTRVRHPSPRESTKSLIVSARDPKGVQFIVTTLDKPSPVTSTQGDGLLSQGTPYSLRYLVPDEMLHPTHTYDCDPSRQVSSLLDCAQWPNGYWCTRLCRSRCECHKGALRTIPSCID